VAGFYQLVATGGDAYLALRDVLQELKRSSLVDLTSDKESFVKRSLGLLKNMAAELVKSLVRSTLQLPDKDGLEYLTCVLAGKEDLPWEVECDGDADCDEDEEMED